MFKSLSDYAPLSFVTSLFGSTPEKPLEKTESGEIKNDWERILSPTLATPTVKSEESEPEWMTVQVKAKVPKSERKKAFLEKAKVNEEKAKIEQAKALEAERQSKRREEIARTAEKELAKVRRHRELSKQSVFFGVPTPKNEEPVEHAKMSVSRV